MNQVASAPVIRPPGHLSLPEVGRRLSMKPVVVEYLVHQRDGGIVARYVNGELLVRESDLARFIALRRSRR